MKKILHIIIYVLAPALLFSQPISLNPANPHYFLFKGKPFVVISSSEHYGAVLNPDFDYMLYLNTLEKDGMNYTRLFAGTYFEKEGSFDIEFNTLAPAFGKALLPWKRSNIPGAAGGGNKFDLDQWEEAYFTRLKSYISEASKRGIVVEVTLFSSIYDFWDIQVWNPENNISIHNGLLKKDVQTLNNGKVLDYQEKFVRKIVNVLNEFDNITYEIQNEPWSDHSVSLKTTLSKSDSTVKDAEDWRNKVEIADQASHDWQKKIASFIADEESHLPKKHLIAQNYANHYYAVPEVDPNVSILNFHYDFPEVVGMNYHHNRVIGYDETGFAGSEDVTYRKEAWRFIIAGGGLFNNLDYSFTTGHEDGTARNKAPGGGSQEYRKQLRVLSDFLQSFDFIRMKPDKNAAPGDSAVWVLSEPGRQYAIYVDRDKIHDLSLNLPGGNYNTEWISTFNGSVVRSEKLNHKGGLVTLTCPQYSQDIALKMIKK